MKCPMEVVERSGEAPTIQPEEHLYRVQAVDSTT